MTSPRKELTEEDSGSLRDCEEAPVESATVREVASASASATDAVLADGDSNPASADAAYKVEVQINFADKYLSLLPVWQEALTALSIVGNCAPSDRNFLERAIHGLNEIKAQLTFIRENGFDKNQIMHDLGNSFTKLIFLQFVDLKDRPEAKKALTDVSRAIAEFDAYWGAINAARNAEISWKGVLSGEFKGSAMGKIENLFESGAMEIFKGRRILLIDDNKDLLQGTQAILQRGGAKALSYNPRHEAFAAGFDAVLENAFEDGMMPQLILLDNDLGLDARGEREYGHQLIPRLRSRFPGALILGYSADAPALNAVTHNGYRSAGVNVVGKMDFKAIISAFKAALPDVSAFG